MISARPIPSANHFSNPSQLWKIYLTLGRLHNEAKQPELAERSYCAARGIIDKIIENTQNPELRAGLKNHLLIRQLIDLSHLCGYLS